MTDKILSLYRRRDTVVIFRDMVSDPAFVELMVLLGSDTDKVNDFLSDYTDFVTELYKTGSTDLSQHLLKITLDCENIYTQLISAGKKPDKNIQDCLIHELQFLQEVSQLTPEDLTEELDYSGYLPRWDNSPIDFIGSYSERMSLAAKRGFGKWAKSSMFVLRGGELSPVKFPDKQTLAELYGYERERKAVIDNTLALLNGKPALNALLYGDAGTGKSSTVKAIVNEFSDRGLRLIELSKEQIRDIPQVIEEISANPLKFIIYIDDLSFTAGEDCFGALKAMLEGSTAARTGNMVIYATSNRRHLIKESFSDREGDDVHRNDTMQEMLSLSARFGLRVNFSRPDKKKYVAIAAELAKAKGIDMPEEELSLKAEQFAVSSGNGRSPRTAKQFVDQLINEQE